ncbi:chromosome partitioning protein ParB [Streptomyces hainanensis]|uniref:Chromosome partitioning protein ParB n=1 Tax=Streptomyces hainanensis TaxID=402648 RepID=A0A4R4TML5_9ACTN|nr:chromosome partitioning protein ParB [Streptomyces hainanensis]
MPRVKNTGQTRRRGAWLATAALVGVVGVAGAGTAEARGRGPQAGDLITVSLAELRPTQPAIGYDQIYYKLGRYAAEPDKAFDDWCEANGQGEADEVTSRSRLDDARTFSCTIPLGEETEDSIAVMKTVVIGPGGKLYLTDGHHTFTSFWEAQGGGSDTRIRVRVVDNLSDLSMPAFWREMQAQNWVWLRDGDNRPITANRLSRHIGLRSLGEDPYRALVYFTRDIGYAQPDDATEFLEFYWASWVRENYDLDDYDLADFDTYLALVRQVSEDMVALDPDTVVAGGRTAAELGRLAEWNDGEPEDDGEWEKLSRPITDDKPGKLAYALEYRESVADEHHHRAA